MERTSKATWQRAAKGFICGVLIWLASWQIAKHAFPVRGQLAADLKSIWPAGITVSVLFPCSLAALRGMR